MEKQTRISKYKDLRNEMKEEVGIDRQIDINQNDEDDDFLSFIPKENKPNIEDTLDEPLSYENLKDENESVQSAILLAKENVGKNQYNTRLDILNKIKMDEEENIDSIETADQEKKMSLLEKLATMSPEEDAKELREYEENMTVQDIMSKKKKLDDDIEEVEGEKESKVIKILNYGIVLFILVFIVLVGLIIKQLFF